MSPIAFWAIIFALCLIVIIVTIANVKQARLLRPLIQQVDLLKQSLELAEKIGGIGSFCVDNQNNNLHWSENVFAIHGRPLSKGPPQLAAAIAYYHPSDRSRVVETVNDALRAGKSYELKARIIAENGMVKKVISRAICQMDGDGEVRYVYGVFIEIAPDMPIMNSIELAENEITNVAAIPRWANG